MNLEVPAAVSASVAKGIAQVALTRGEAARVRRTVPAGLGALHLRPGEVVTLSDDQGRWRVEEVLLEGMATRLTLSPLPEALPAVAPAAGSGRVLAQRDLPIGRTLLTVAELPGLDDVPLAQPRLVVLAAGEGEGWRAAPLLLSLDDGASWTPAGATALPATVGRVDLPAEAGQVALIDRVAVLEVTLARADMMLADADTAALDRGANLALVGDELIQFGRAEPLGGARWRLAELWRGRRGTVPVAGAVGDRFALLTSDTVRAIDLPLSVLGTTVQLMAAGVGDGAAPAVSAVPVTGASVRPLAPVALRWRASDDGGARVTWTRRSRAGWRWLDGIDAPLGEEAESYRVTIEGAVGRELVVSVPEMMLTAADRAGATVRVSVRQRGSFGESEPAMIDVEGV